MRMRTLALCGVVVFFGGLSTARARSAIWEEAVGGNGHLYEFVGESMTWMDAKVAAEGRTPPAGFGTGHLVTISNADENCFAYGLTTNGESWLGFTDILMEGEWRWIDNTPGIWQDPDNFADPIQTAWTNWYAGEPNDFTPGEDFATFQGSQWNDGTGTHAMRFVVEYEPLPVPEPSALALLAVGLAVLTCARCTRHHRKGAARVAVLVALSLLTGSAWASVGIETVPVGNPGNNGELSGAGAGVHGLDRICGAVNYAYNIGKYEVTAGQYAEFLNAVADTDTYGLYNSNMWSDSDCCKIQRTGSSGSYTYSVAGDWANRPVDFVSWGDAARFANWLHNGQPTGAQDLSTTEDGAYFLNGATSDAALLAVSREAGWKWAIPTEDEWYKAAYYNPVASSYFDYPTGSDTAPGYVDNDGDLSGTSTTFVDGVTDPGNYATYDRDEGTNGIGSPYYRTEVGEWENSASPYGTFDQGGNVWEWNEAILYGSFRGLRGGSFLYSYGGGSLHAAFRLSDPTRADRDVGFRVVSVPEPATLALLAMAVVGLVFGLRRRSCVALVAVAVSLSLGACPVNGADIFTEDVTFVDGDDYWSVEVRDDAHVEVLGGRFGNRLQLYENATGRLVGGDIRGIFAMEGSARASIYPGTYINTYIYMAGLAELDIYGGRMPDRYIDASSGGGEPLITFHGSSLLLDPAGGSYGEGIVTGVFTDGEPFSVDLRYPGTAARIRLAPVPEPSTAALLALAAVGLAVGWRRSTRQSK